MNEAEKYLYSISDKEMQKILSDLVRYIQNYLYERKLVSEKFLKGKSAYDFAIEAIEKVFKNEYKWQPERSSLFYYLSTQVTKSIISNYINKEEIKLNSVSEIELYENNLPSHSSISGEIDVDYIIKYLTEKCSNDPISMKILDGKLDGLSRKEICKKYNIDNQSYINGYKRLFRKIDDLNLFKLL